MQCEDRELLKQRLSVAVRDLIVARSAAPERNRTVMLAQAQSVLRRVRGDYTRHLQSHGCDRT
jgi:uncharacterized protein YfaQ (DUF2300 family)